MIIYINIFFYKNIFLYFFFWHGGVDANNTGLPPSAATLGAVLFLKKKIDIISIRFDLMEQHFFAGFSFFFTTTGSRRRPFLHWIVAIVVVVVVVLFFRNCKNDLKKKIKSNRNRFDKEMNQKIDHFFTVVAAAVAVVLFLRN